VQICKGKLKKTGKTYSREFTTLGGAFGLKNTHRGAEKVQDYKCIKCGNIVEQSGGGLDFCVKYYKEVV